MVYNTKGDNPGLLGVTSYNPPGTAGGSRKAPSWRRPKQEVIDEKIERMLETYKLMDEVHQRKEQLGYVSVPEKRLADKYFPEDGDSEDERKRKSVNSYDEEVEIDNDDEEDGGRN